MVNIVKLNFDVTVECHEESADELGKDLARWFMSHGLMVKMY